MRRLNLLAAAAVVFSALSVEAQVYSIAKPSAAGLYVYPTGQNPIDILTKHHRSGDWVAFQESAHALLKTLAGRTTPAGADVAAALGEVDRNYYSIVWSAPGADGKPEVNRVLVRSGLAVQHSARLTGVSQAHPERGAGPAGVRVLDVLLSDDKSASLASTWVFKPVEDPLVAQIPAVVERINPLVILAQARGTVPQPGPRADAAASILVAVSEVRVLLSSSEIEIKDAIVTSRNAGQLSLAVQKVSRAVVDREARTSPCAQALARQIVASVAEASTDAECTTCGKAIVEAVEGGFTTLLESRERALCTPDQPWGPIAATEAAFLAAVSDAGKKVLYGKSSLKNKPLTRFSFGVMTGLMVGRPSLDQPRAKVEGGKLVAEPIERVMTMVILNVHPSPYDADWTFGSWAERLRLFGGAVLTPDFGITAGVGIGIVRGLSVNAGGVMLWNNALKEGETFDQPPVNRNDPLKARASAAGFFGFSYAFK